MKPAELERAILDYPLPAVALAKPRNTLFLVRSAAAAVRLLSSLPFRPVRRLYPATGSPLPPLDLERAALAYSLTEYLLRSPLFPWRRTCLRRSLLLSHLLRRSGVPVKTAFGVDPAESGWEGHCWLVFEGAPFLEAGEEERTFVPVFQLPDEGAAAGEGRDDGDPPRA